MKRLTVLFLFISFSAVNFVYGWGDKGHSIIAAIAERHLTPKAHKSVQNLLGHPMVYYASWLDQVRTLPPYAETTSWHYANVDEGESYETMQKNPDGDVYTQMTMVIARLKERNLSDSLRILYTKCLIHLVGDMHCPMHTGRLSDLGGNKFPVKWFGQPTNLHAVWDEKLIESAHSWSYTEWCENIDVASDEERTTMAAGTPLEWLKQCVDLCKKIYLSSEENKDYSYDYIRDHIETVEIQLKKAGYRLAALLNEIYQ